MLAGKLIQEASPGVLKNLVQTLLSFTLDPRHQQSNGESQELIRSVHILLTTLFKTADPTNMLRYSKVHELLPSAALQWRFQASLAGSVDVFSVC